MKNSVDLRNSGSSAFGGRDSPIGSGRILGFAAPGGPNAKSNAALKLSIPDNKAMFFAAEKTRLHTFHERKLVVNPIFVRSRNLNQPELPDPKDPGFLGAMHNYFDTAKPTKLRDSVKIMSEITKSRRSKS
jgi:hypothetical protein